MKSKNPWAFPLVPIKKEDKSIRICVDYRKLTLPDTYPLPSVQECLDALQGAKWFSTLDCASGFFKFRINLMTWISLPSFAIKVCLPSKFANGPGK